MGWTWTGDAKEAKQRAQERLDAVIDEETVGMVAVSPPLRRRKRRGDWYPSPRRRIGLSHEQEAAINDGIFGRGRWVECSLCPDSDGRPGFHDSHFHDGG